MADNVERTTVPDQERVTNLLRRTADRKGVQASTGVLLDAYRIAYLSPEDRDDAAPEWVAMHRSGAIDSRLVAEAMLREWALWSSPS